MSTTYVYHKKFRFDEGKSDYMFRVKKHNWKWLWLLLLLPLLLLFVRCERKIDVQTLDGKSQIEIPQVDISFTYTSHYLFKDGTFFKSEHHLEHAVTDEHGRATFEPIRCSVFSYIFYALSKATFMADDECHDLDPDPAVCLLHYTWKKKITMLPKTTDQTLYIVDKETSDPLACASVVYEYDLSGQTYTDSVVSNAAGSVNLKHIPSCGTFIIKKVSCYGYEEVQNLKKYVPILTEVPDSAIVALNPMKQSFTYFVKNKFTDEPVPGATVDVRISTRNGQVIRGRSTTNVDGRGRGVFEDAFILADVSLKANKKHYKEGTLTRNYTVEEFAALPDSQRVVYMEPEPYMEKFQNVDSLTGVPISGVTNDINCSSISGDVYQEVEISNRNGIFYIKALEGDCIDIHSNHDYYEPKSTHIEKFNKGQVIEMQPRKVDLRFSTVEASMWEILPDCKLVISTTVSGVSTPHNSGNGQFVVEGVYCSEEISIVASKQGYSTNSTKINHTKVFDLVRAPQNARDIPLKIDLPPCNGGNSEQSKVSAGSVSAPQSFNMGTMSGSFEFEYDTSSSCPDQIDIYNHNVGESYSASNRIWSSGMVTTGGVLQTEISFNRGSIITIIVTTGSSDDSFWKYYVHCPN